MIFSLPLCRVTRAENPNRPLSFDVTDEQQTFSGRVSDDDLAVFVRGMVLVVEDSRQGVPETVSPSSKDTPCFKTLEAAFRGSHSNRKPVADMMIYTTAVP